MADLLIFYRGRHFPGNIIAHAVWLYLRFPLSFRDVAELLAERGIQVSDDTVRRWVIRFGPHYAAELRKRDTRPGRTWHLDEMAVRIGRKRHWLWRAVDEHGATLDVLMQERRNTDAAERFFRTLLGHTDSAPERITTDKLGRTFPRAPSLLLSGSDHGPPARLAATRGQNPQPAMTWSGLALVLSGLLLGACGGATARGVAPRAPVVSYDFEHPASGDRAVERDQGSSGTPFHLVNGGAAMRVRDGAHPRSTWSIQTRQVNPAVKGNDDWKGGIFFETGVPSLGAFARARGITILGWVKRTGTDRPAPNSNTADPADRYNAVGLMGILSGTSTGHDVRALLEGIRVADTLRLVALGRRLDEGGSRVFAARESWGELLPLDEWVFLAATFDFDDGTMALYRNGLPLDGFYTSAADLWGIAGPPEPDLTSPTVPRGIKVGGSFPQNSQERNPFDGRFDDLTFLDWALSADQVLSYHRRFRR